MDLLRDSEPNQVTVSLIRTLEQHSYMRLTELLDGNHLDDACKVADLMQRVGLI